VDIDRILAELKQGRDRLDRAIAALEGTESGGGPSSPATPPKKAPVAKPARGMTPQGRQRMSRRMKQRWPEARKKGLKRLG
jgi:hypothetical protein